MADEEFEELKKEADKAPEKYSNALRFLRNHTFNFDGEFWFISPTYNNEKKIKGTFKIIPTSFRVMYSVGRPTLYLVSRVVFEDIEFENPDFGDELKTFLETGLVGSDLLKVSNVFKQAPDNEFRKLKRLIAMDDLSLLINEVDVEKLM